MVGDLDAPEKGKSMIVIVGGIKGVVLIFESGSGNRGTPSTAVMFGTSSAPSSSSFSITRER